MRPENPTDFRIPFATPPSHPGASCAWPALVERHGARVRRSVRRTLAALGERTDPDRVDDLVQEVWCRLLERERSGRRGARGASEGEVAAYLCRVSASVVVDALRAAGAAKRRPAGFVRLEPGADAPQAADRRTCPLRRLLARERLRPHLALCRDLVGRRDRRERLHIVRLAVVTGMTSREIAERLGGRWTPGGIDSLLFRLRRRLAARGEALPVRGVR
jgi:DNA-directed RNA polymerase specialized sigma24 family protein